MSFEICRPPTFCRWGQVPPSPPPEVIKSTAKMIIMHGNDSPYCSKLTHAKVCSALLESCSSSLTHFNVSLESFCQYKGSSATQKKVDERSLRLSLNSKIKIGRDADGCSISHAYYLLSILLLTTENLLVVNISDMYMYINKVSYYDLLIVCQSIILYIGLISVTLQIQLIYF